MQAFATQEKLKEYFDDVTFIDYRRADTYGIGLFNTFAKGNPIRGLAILPTLMYWRHRFGDFRKYNLNMTDKVYFVDSDLEQLDDCADVYFTGSDQMWNTGWNNGVIPPFYLSFVPNDKPKFAYAASFGKTRLIDEEVARSKKYIDKYRLISVREESGVEILKKQYDYQNAVRIVDPTLAMPPEFWRNVAPPSKIKEDYILAYNLNSSKELDNYANELAWRTGYKLYRLCTRFDQILKNGKSIVIPPIFDFVTLIDNAKFIITDSFHATAFAMNLNTEPVCVYPNSYSGRISEFLHLTNSEQRHAESFEDFDIVSRKVDFEKVNKILLNERKKVDDFLSNVRREVN